MVRSFFKRMAMKFRLKRDKKKHSNNVCKYISSIYIARIHETGIIYLVWRAFYFTKRSLFINKCSQQTKIDENLFELFN